MTIGECRSLNPYRLTYRAFDSKTTAVDFGLNAFNDNALSSVGR